MYSSLFSELPALYNSTLRLLQKENSECLAKMSACESEASERVDRAEEQVKSLKILLDMQQQWHSEVDAQIDKWQESVRGFNEKLKTELKIQKDQYEDRIADLQSQLDSTIAERDAYRSQIDWEQKSISDRELAVVAMRKELAHAKSLLEEREQTLYTTRAHFERQFTFMKEQMGQMTTKGNYGADVESLRSVTQYLPRRQGPQLQFLPLNQLNRRIIDILLAKARHDGAYTQGNEPPLYQFIIKYHIGSMLSYTAAVPAIWQFLSSGGRYRHESIMVGLFMNQVESQNDTLYLIEYMAILVRKEDVGESGLPRLSITRCAELAKRLLPQDQVDKLKALIERKIVNPKRGMVVDFDVFLMILIDLLADVNHVHRQRVMHQFKELESSGAPIDWPTFSDLVGRFAPLFSSQQVCDLFLESIQASLPTPSVTASAFQLLVDRGLFEQLTVNINEEFEVASPDETASFVNMRWVADLMQPVSNAITELRTERPAECHKLYSDLTRIFDHMKGPCTREDAGAGLSMLHLAAIVLARFKFLKIARKDSIEAQREVRRAVDIVWS
jgi:hypothetical protein